MRRTLVRCTACGRSYTALLAGDEQVFVQTSDGNCWCGRAEFEEASSRPTDSQSNS